ncbi:MAG: FctA domain-containing protein [Bacillota bacterium]|nr:FctA domain-containing protein [Bacillota bacterium]
MKCNKNIKRTFLIMFLTILCVGMFCSTKVSAIGNTNNSISVRIPVYCEQTNATETFHYQIQSTRSNHVKLNSTEIDLKSNETKYFAIDFNYPGTYHFFVKQVSGNNQQIKYDKSVYCVDVYVSENENGFLFAEPILYLKDSDAKVAQLHFKNIQESAPVVSLNDVIKNTTKTGDTTNLITWIVMLMVSSILLIGFILWKINKRKEVRKSE